MNLNEASYEDLRGLGLSVTQTGRILALREGSGSFSSFADLETIPGFDDEFVAGLRDRVRF